MYPGTVTTLCHEPYTMSPSIKIQVTVITPSAQGTTDALLMAECSFIQMICKKYMG